MAKDISSGAAWAALQVWIEAHCPWHPQSAVLAKDKQVSAQPGAGPAAQVSLQCVPVRSCRMIKFLFLSEHLFFFLSWRCDVQCEQPAVW